MNHKVLINDNDENDISFIQSNNKNNLNENNENNKIIYYLIITFLIQLFLIIIVWIKYKRLMNNKKLFFKKNL